MKERYEGAGRPALIRALRDQEWVRDDEALAEAIAQKGELVEFAKGDDLIVQSATDDEIFLLLMGSVAIIINGAQVTTRVAGMPVGEMAAIEPSLPRSATVRALRPVVALKIPSQDFMTIGQSFPKIWLPIAQMLAKRLHSRNKTISVPNPEPKLFIISSSEALPIAHAIRDELETTIFTKVWDQGVFFAGGYPLEALEQQLTVSDFAVAVAEADDLTTSRGATTSTVRDNVVFELGLFMGKLTRYRAILIHPRIAGLQLPSDLHGLTVLRYEPGDPATAKARVQDVCEKLRGIVAKAGVRTFTFAGDD